MVFWKDLPVKNGILCIGICVAAIILGGCEAISTEDSEPLHYEPIVVHPSKTLTLPVDQLLSLDWHSPHRRGGRVEAVRPIAEGGVEFDIYFPSNNPGDNEVTFVSSGEGGLGALAGNNIEGYERFVLKYTLISINGKASIPDMSRKLTVGSLIGPSAGKLKVWQPLTLSLSGSGISSTSMRTKKIYQIGFHARMTNPLEWDATGAKVTLRIEPAENAGPVPARVLVEKR